MAKSKTKWVKLEKEAPDAGRGLYKKTECSLSRVRDDERDYIRMWCTKRYIDDSYAIRAIIYWIRVRSSLAVFFMLRENNRELYMIICIHVAMKWQGYDEIYKCDYLRDLRMVDPRLASIVHQDMEYHVLTSLGWELGP